MRKASVAPRVAPSRIPDRAPHRAEQCAAGKTEKRAGEEEHGSRGIEQDEAGRRPDTEAAQPGLDRAGIEEIPVHHDPDRADGEHQ